MEKVIKVVALGLCAVACFVVGWSLKAWQIKDKEQKQVS